MRARLVACVFAVSTAAMSLTADPDVGALGIYKLTGTPCDTI